MSWRRSPTCQPMSSLAMTTISDAQVIGALVTAVVTLAGTLGASARWLSGKLFAEGTGLATRGLARHDQWLSETVDVQKRQNEILETLATQNAGIHATLKELAALHHSPDAGFSTLRTNAVLRRAVDLWERYTLADEKPVAADFAELRRLLDPLQGAPS